MKDRLLKFLNSQQLSSARFAEIIGVQPSGISHILSGRNKPGFDFIQKILTSYPSLSAEWLIMGKGSMLKSENVQGDLFTGEYYGIESQSEKDKETSGNHLEGKDTGNGDKTNLGDTYVNKFDTNDNYKGKHHAAGSITDVNKGREIKKIVIFYSDKSFSEYSPE
jgi:transcriptional regulator with XRE-family HTH domain